MATITTKFNVGDKAYTIDKKTMKVTEFEVGSIIVYLRGDDRPSIDYRPKTEDFAPDMYSEDMCFATKEELMEYISQ